MPPAPACDPVPVVPRPAPAPLPRPVDHPPGTLGTLCAGELYLNPGDTGVFECDTKVTGDTVLIGMEGTSGAVQAELPCCHAPQRRPDRPGLMGCACLASSPCRQHVRTWMHGCIVGLAGAAPTAPHPPAPSHKDAFLGAAAWH